MPFRLHPHSRSTFPSCKLGCGTAGPKPRETALPTSHPRGYFYCTKRLLKAALAAAKAGEAPLRPRRAPIGGPTSAASSPSRLPSCILHPPPLGAACSSDQGCPQVFFADSLPRTPSTSRFYFHILHGKSRAMESEKRLGANGRSHFCRWRASERRPLIGCVRRGAGR